MAVVTVAKLRVIVEVLPSVVGVVLVASRSMGNSRLTVVTVVAAVKYEIKYKY